LNNGRENQLFQSELAKYNPLQSRLSNNINSHSKLLHDLSQEFSKLESGPQIKMLESLELKRQKLINFWNDGVNECFQCRNGLVDALKFYNDMTAALKKLSQDTDNFVSRRSSEAQQLTSRIEHISAEESNIALKLQMDQLNMNSHNRVPISNTIAYGANPAYSPSHTSFEANNPKSQIQDGYIGSPSTQQYLPAQTTQQYSPPASTQQYLTSPNSQSYSPQQGGTHLPGPYNIQRPTQQSYSNSHTANLTSSNTSQYSQPYSSSHSPPKVVNTLPPPVPFTLQSHQFGTPPQAQLPNTFQPPASLPHPLHHEAPNQSFPGILYL
jgi:uncharacterized protein YoxC